MVTKKEAANTEVDWDTVAMKTEIPRTYLVKVPGGGIIFKMYKPSEFAKGNVAMQYKESACRVKMVGKKDISGKSHKEKTFKEICHERQIKEMFNEEKMSYGYSYTGYKRGTVYG